MAIWVAMEMRSSSLNSGCRASTSLPRGCDQPVEQVVRFHAEALAPGNLDVGSRLIFLGKHVAEFGRAAWGQGDHFIREMRVVIRLIVVAESAQCIDDRVLRFRLAGINDVVDFRNIAEVRMIFLSFSRRISSTSAGWDRDRTCDNRNLDPAGRTSTCDRQCLFRRNRRCRSIGR